MICLGVVVRLRRLPVRGCFVWMCERGVGSLLGSTDGK